MKFFSKKNIAVGIIALVIGIFAFAGAAKAFFQSNATVTGNVTAFILNPDSKVDGAVLDTNDQIHFGAETGAIVSSQIKIGDALTATGRVGSSSSFGRELRAETLQINGNTITIVHARPMPPRKDGKDKPMPPHDKKGDRPAPPAPNEAQQNAERSAEEAGETPAANGQEPKSAPRETTNVNGTIKIVLVGGRGEARGLILNGGEQIALPKEVAKAGLNLNQETQVSAEGAAAQSDFGKFIRPTRLTIGNQTFSFNR